MRKYKAIIINLNSSPDLNFQPVFPIGAVYVHSYLKQIGAESRFIDFFVSPSSFESLEFLNEDFDCIGFSLRNIDSMELDSVFYAPYYRKIMERIVNRAKEINPSTLVLLGGGGYSVYHNGLKDLLPFDIGITGNVEEDLYDAIYNHSQQLGGGFHLLPNFHPFPLDFNSELVHTYIKKGAKQIGIPTRCGGRCPMKCVYCSYGKIDNKTNITRPLNILKEDILSLYNMGIREVFFTDSLFNISLSHAKEICRMIIDLNLPDFQWSAYAKPTTNMEFIELAKRSGCKSLQISFDTFDPEMLKTLKKGFNQDQAIEFIENCKKWELDLMGLFLFGGPGENEETIKETCRIINKYFKRGEFFFSFGMRVLPGSLLADLSGIPEEDMVKPLFWPFEESCFDYVLTHLDQRFLRFNNLGKISSWRREYKKMRLEMLPKANKKILQGTVAL
ncbi:radical SAM protein [Bacillus sp. E(2018)]|uniref:B12-binding domain-containing radical SAM protein n=1 Tax=Bacillus sp. E(2018) TaxID=2502239 RepID=UPI0010FA1273|nr:radical SAM protein [Bacillus sp. E(2018)]